MGCTSITMIQSRKVVPLSPETVNSYIDKFPAIVLLKIREKFEMFADRESKDISHLNFLKLYSASKLNPQMTKRLFFYFNDRRKENLKFRQFMSKIATITKCQSNVFYKILFEIYKNNTDIDLMSEQQYQTFIKSETEYLNNEVTISNFPITLERFVQFLTEAEFKVSDYQSKFMITTEKDIPFEEINKQLLFCDFNDLTQGSQYYIISNSWYYRWSFYYQEVNHSLQNQHIKSTKMLLDDKFSIGKKRRKRQSKQILPSIRSSEVGNTLIQQPNIIDFDDIQGQFRGQLKENLKISTQIKIVSQNLWKLLRSLHSAQQQFKRTALNQDTLQYYPKLVYYAEANQKGRILPSTQQLKQISISKKAQILAKQKSQLKKRYIFAKKFGDKNWRQINQNQSFAEISLDPRFFIVIAPNKEAFIDENYRKQITKQNLTLGDEIYVHFPYIKTAAEAIIIGLSPEQDKLKVHFKNYSFRYEIDINRSQVSFVQSQAVLTSAKKKHQSIIKGIANIGNTCFINSIIQCLVGTAVFDNFLLDYHFSQKLQPMGYGLAEMAKLLLKDQKPIPQDFKKLIDINMPSFSGYDQHDAQQFLNILLDKISQQIPDKPTVIDYLFGGNTQSKLTCGGCKKTKTIDQKMYILSLPIPQSEYNYFSIIIVPTSSKNMKKIIFMLHKNATVGDYANMFQERTRQSKKDFLFCQTNYNSLKKIKNQITAASFQKKKIVDIGIVPNLSLLAFEKIPIKVYHELISSKLDDGFKDFQPPSQTFWTVCKIGEAKNKDKLCLQYLNLDNEIEKAVLDKQMVKQSFAKLGNKSSSEIPFKKIILRKYNAALKKLQSFGIELLIGIPRWASYIDAIQLIERYIDNLKTSEARRYKKSEGGDYIIRFLDPQKYKCIFCLKDVQMFNLSQKQLIPCCQVSEKEIPIAWLAKQKSLFWVYIDWIDFSKCNSYFCSYIDVDQTSKNIEVSRQQQQINLEDCIKLHHQKQEVQMECDNCKEKIQSLEHGINKMPNILVVHMKEFRYTPQGHLIKLDLRLKWQQFLDFSKFAICNQGKIYELYALVRHSGNSHSGHYTSMVKRKHPFENKKIWVNFDDDLTDIVKQQQKYIDDAYLLFYKKVDMPTSSLVIYSD